MPSNFDYSLLNKDLNFLKQEELKNNKILRLLQVRDQNKRHASLIRQNVHKKKCDEIIKISHKIEQEHNEKLEVKIREEEKKYKEGLENFGCAKNGIEDVETKLEAVKVQEKINKSNASIRYKDAFEKLKKMEEIKKRNEQNKKERKENVKRKEKLRAKKVASMPRPEPEVVPESTSSVKLSRNFINQSLGSSYFCTAVRHEDEDYDAKEAAVKEAQLQKQMETKINCNNVAMDEKARVRHKRAVDQEMLERDLEGLEKEIQLLRRKEIMRR